MGPRRELGSFQVMRRWLENEGCLSPPTSTSCASTLAMVPGELGIEDGLLPLVETGSTWRWQEDKRVVWPTWAKKDFLKSDSWEKVVAGQNLYLVQESKL